MVKRWRIWVLLISAFAYARPLLAQDIASWLETASKKFKPQRVAFLTKFGSAGLPVFKTLDGQSLGFLHIVKGEQARLQFMLNDYRPGRKGYKPETSLGKVEAMQAVLDLAAVVVAPSGKNKQWLIVGQQGGKIAKLAGQAAPSDQGSVGDWLMATLGYEGVIVDQRDDLLLVATLPGRLKGRSQGVVLKQSASRLIYPRDPSAGAALIELVEASGDFGVFRVILDGGDGSAVKGAKVLLQEGG